MHQDRQLVAEYTEEFWDLDSRLNWPEEILIGLFKDGLNNNLYKACITQGAQHAFTVGTLWIKRQKLTWHLANSNLVEPAGIPPQKGRGRRLSPQLQTYAQLPISDVVKKATEQLSAFQRHQS